MGRGIGLSSVLRPGMTWTGVGMTKVSILKLLMEEYPEFDGGDADKPGIYPPSRALAIALPFDSYNGTSS